MNLNQNDMMDEEMRIKSEQAERASEGDHEHQSDGQKSLGPCVESTVQHLNTGVGSRVSKQKEFSLLECSAFSALL